ncbi:MAG TPA: hypothetical protein VNG91_06970 [Terriglobia bacterium]|nr:hypothetical protein [Terriglobia bacterium]
MLKNPLHDVILSEAKDLLGLFFRRYSRCIASLSMTDTLFQQPAKRVSEHAACILTAGPYQIDVVFPSCQWYTSRETLRTIGKIKADVAQSSSQGRRLSRLFRSNNRICMNISRFVLVEGEAPYPYRLNRN